MEVTHFEIVRYTDQYRNQLLEVWEKSVLATHSFLKPDDFDAIKKLVGTIDFNAFEVYCLMQADAMAGFLGVADQKLEMLFLSPRYIGKKMGKKLIECAMNELQIDKVDVNEQNKKAVEFYQKFGFTVYERTNKDDQGKNYPLLRMRLENR